jgi:hypothetical protein
MKKELILVTADELQPDSLKRAISEYKRVRPSFDTREWYSILANLRFAGLIHFNSIDSSGCTLNCSYKGFEKFNPNKVSLPTQYQSVNDLLKVGRTHEALEKLRDIFNDRIKEYHSEEVIWAELKESKKHWFLSDGTLFEVEG